MRRRCISAALVLGALGLLSQAAVGEEPQPKRDRYGDPLPQGAVLRLGTTRLQAKGGSAWMPDGKTLVAKHGAMAYFWNIETGKLQRELLVPTQSNYGSNLAVSPDGKRLIATDTKGAIAIWDLAETKLFAQPAFGLEQNKENLLLVVPPDGETFLTLNATGELQVRDMATADVRRTIQLPKGRWDALACSAISPDGATLALTDGPVDKLIRLVNLKEGAASLVIPHGHYQIYGLAFLADGSLVSSGLVKGADAEPVPALKNHFRVWDVAKAKLLEEWPVEPTLTASCELCTSPDGRTLVSVHPDRIVSWDVATKKIVRSIEGLRFWNAAEARVQIDPLGKYIAVNDRNNYVRIWELATGRPFLTTDQHHQGVVVSASWSPEGALIATGDGRGDFILWDAASGEIVRKVRGPEWGVWGVAFAPGGRVIAAGEERDERRQVRAVVRWHESATGKLASEHQSPGRPRELVPSPDAAQVAFYNMGGDDPFGGFGSTIEVVEAASGKALRKIAPHGGRVVGIGWSPDSKTLLSVGEDSNLVQTRVDTGMALSKVKLPHQARDRTTGELVSGGTGDAVFHSDGKNLVTTGALPEIYGWDVASGEKQWTIKLEGRWIRALAVTPDGRRVAGLTSEGDESDKTLHVYDVASRREVAKFGLGVENTQFAALSPDGTRALVGFYDGTALVFDIPN